MNNLSNSNNNSEKISVVKRLIKPLFNTIKSVKTIEDAFKC